MTRRRWRWVTRDKDTDYKDTVSIWPGASKPTSREWNGRKWVSRSEDGVFQYHQGQGDSIDIDAADFKAMHGFAVGKGDLLKVEFSLEVLE